MPSVVEKTFKLKWLLEDFSLYTENTAGERYWITTGTFTIDALNFTHWQVILFPRTEGGFTACALQRSALAAEVEDITFHYSVTISGKKGRVLFHHEGVMQDLPPTHASNVSRIPTEDLSPRHLEGDQLDVTFEVRLGRSSSPTDVRSVKWKDELRLLSDDMRKLFRSGYRSDVELVSSEGRSIAAHLWVLFARWRDEFNEFKGVPSSPKRIVLDRMDSRLLTSFVSYLYTGTIPGSELTVELFDLVVEKSSCPRNCFHTGPREKTYRTQHLREQVAFTWWVSDAPVHFHRVLPLTHFEVLVDICTVGDDNSKVGVWLSLSRVPRSRFVHLQCSTILNTDDVDRIVYSAGHYFDGAFRPWAFPHALQLADSHRVDFEICFSVYPRRPTLESTVTEFDTESRGVWNVELLSTEFHRFFVTEPIDGLFDIELITDEGSLHGCKSFFGARSSKFRQIFDDFENKTFDHVEGSDVTIPITPADRKTFLSVLLYLYTGSTKIASMEDAMKILTLAKEMSLDGLVRKCKQFISIFLGMMLQ